MKRLAVVALVGMVLGFVRKVVAAKITAMTGWRPAWQGVTNSLMHHGN